jgi:hypothetical protein
LLVPYNEALSHRVFDRLCHDHQRISRIVVHSAPENRTTAIDDLQVSIYYRTDQIDSPSCCGEMHPGYFLVDLDLFTEAQQFNTCLNRKLSTHKAKLKIARRWPTLLAIAGRSRCAAPWPSHASRHYGLSIRTTSMSAKIANFATSVRTAGPLSPILRICTRNRQSVPMTRTQSSGEVRCPAVTPGPHVVDVDLFCLPIYGVLLRPVACYSFPCEPHNPRRLRGEQDHGPL